jgi:hypothetical protein
VSRGAKVARRYAPAAASGLTSTRARLRLAAVEGTDPKRLNTLVAVAERSCVNLGTLRGDIEVAPATAATMWSTVGLALAAGIATSGGLVLRVDDPIDLAAGASGLMPRQAPAGPGPACGRLPRLARGGPMPSMPTWLRPRDRSTQRAYEACRTDAEPERASPDFCDQLLPRKAHVWRARRSRLGHSAAMPSMDVDRPHRGTDA